MVFSRRETAILLIGDFSILAISLWAAITLRNFSFPSFSYFQANLVPFSPLFVLSLAVFYIAGLYEKQTRPIRRSMGVRILGAQAATVTIAAIVFFVLPLPIAPKTILALYLLVSVVGESMWRFYRMNHEISPDDRESACLVGSGRIADELFEEINNNDRFLIRFTSRCETAHLAEGAVYAAIHAAVTAGARKIVIDVTDPIVARELPRVYTLMTYPVTFMTLTTLYTDIFDRIPLEYVDVEQLLGSVSQQRTIYDTGKRLFDILLALVLACVAIPLVALAAAALMFSGGNPFISSDRIGKGGRVFRMLKLRSMLLNDQGNPELQKKNRVTKLGLFLRKTRIDELPQLWNIFMGDLSFIGPRPELPQIAAVYEREIPEYRLRHLIAPGLSGWAQIHDFDAPRGAADVARTKRKLSFDLYYLHNRSLGLDLVIALKTLRALASFSGT